MSAISINSAKSVVKAAVLGAGITIFLIGLAIAQTAPPASPSATPPAASATQGDNPRRAIAEACRTEIGTTVRGSDRREAMRKCVEEKREKAGLNQRSDRRADRSSKRDDRQNARRACMDQTKDQRLTVEERRNAIQECVAKADPQQAKMLECRKEAEAKKLERRSREFRQHMRTCAGPRRG